MKDFKHKVTARLNKYNFLENTTGAIILSKQIFLTANNFRSVISPNTLHLSMVQVKRPEGKVLKLNSVVRECCLWKQSQIQLQNENPLNLNTTGSSLLSDLEFCLLKPLHSLLALRVSIIDPSDIRSVVIVTQAETKLRRRAVFSL